MAIELMFIGNSAEPMFVRSLRIGRLFSVPSIRSCEYSADHLNGVLLKKRPVADGSDSDEASRAKGRVAVQVAYFGRFNRYTLRCLSREPEPRFQVRMIRPLFCLSQQLHDARFGIFTSPS